MEAAMLILMEGGGKVRHWSLDRPTMTIGRHEECDVSLPDRKVSREHARIERDTNGYTLADLHSKNGTFVNGEPLTGSHRLRDGDEIQVALSFRLTFVDAGATVPLIFEDQVSVGLKLDKEARAIYVNGVALSPALSPAQYRLLELLYDHRDRVVGRGDIVQAVWPEAEEEGVSEQAIDALVRRLRERLAEADPHTNYLVTVRGHGFRLNL